jgi:hypothetical protein
MTFIKMLRLFKSDDVVLPDEIMMSGPHSPLSAKSAAELRFWYF